VRHPNRSRKEAAATGGLPAGVVGGPWLRPWGTRVSTVIASPTSKEVGHPARKFKRVEPVEQNLLYSLTLTPSSQSSFRLRRYTNTWAISVKTSAVSAVTITV